MLQCSSALRSFGVLGLVAFVLGSFGQTPIAEVRDLPIGTSVTVQGIVLNGSEFGGVRYVQDATAGIALFPGTGSVSGFSPARGSFVTVTGVLKNYFGLLEMDPITAYTLNSVGNALPTPQIITPVLLDESREGELVRLNGCQFVNSGTFSSGTHGFTSNGQSSVIYLRSGHPLVGSTIPSGPVNLTGVVSQYSTATPASGGYQLLPRDAADIVISTAISIIGEVQQTDILSSGFTLRWPTNLAGTSQVSYGITPSLGNTAQVGGTATSHIVPITGLLSATFYYAQCWSVLGNDTARSPIGYYSTASSIPGSITAYFTQSTDPSVAIGPLAVQLNNLVDDTLVAYINLAQSTIDYAVYNTTISGIVTALNNAHNSGVTVRVIAEASNTNSALANLDSGIGLLYRMNSTGSGMHDKFLAIDAESTENAVTITGSTNCTASSFFYDANNVVIVRDQALTRAYRTEFEEMWGGTDAQPNVANSRFGAQKTDNTPHLFNVNGTLVESWFSPSDGTTARIADALHTADQRIEFALFAFTSSTLTDVLIDLEAQGRTVRGIMDDMDPSWWNVQDMLTAGIDVRSDNNPDLLHHKYAIVDRDLPAAGPLVITGSHNWSFNAESTNDENTLIIHNATIANQFYQEWSARWNLATGIAEGAVGIDDLGLWPNPATDHLSVRCTMEQGGTISFRISDATGRTVQEHTVANGSGINVTTIDLSALTEGAYTLSITGKASRANARFVRNR